MAAGKILLQKASGGVTTITGVDGIGATELQIPESGILSTSEYNNMLPISSMLKGTFTVSNTVKTKAFDTILHTGNGTSQNVVTGVSAIDFTLPFNGTGYYHDRATGDGIVKTDAGVAVTSGSIAFKDVAGVDGVCKVHIKARSAATNHFVFDGLRGVLKEINTNTTEIEASLASSLTAFTSTGFSVGSAAGINVNAITYVSYVTLYTHIKWGLTSQGKRQLEAYNPVTNDTMIVYKGSGVTGHEIYQSTGVKLDLVTLKRLDASYDWVSGLKDKSGYIVLNSTVSFTTQPDILGSWFPASFQDNTRIVTGVNNVVDNVLDASHIIYGKAKSKTWTIVNYTGTGVAGNFVETKDSDGVARRPARVIIKAVSAVGHWVIRDYKRFNWAGTLYSNLGNLEGVTAGYGAIITATGFYVELGGAGVADSNTNAAGVQYIALVEFDTDGTGTSGSFFDNPTNTTQLQLADGLISISKGITANGATNKVITKSGTISPTNGWL